MRIEVVYAEPDRQLLHVLDVEPGTTVGQALAAALTGAVSAAALAALQAGIWGQPVERSHVLKDGDRVELYRPLQLDPREARRALAVAGKSMSSSD